jgi:hypothetical protein
MQSKRLLRKNVKNVGATVRSRFRDSYGRRPSEGYRRIQESLKKCRFGCGVREREYPDPTEAPRDRKVVSLKEDLEQIGSVSSPTSRFDLGLGGNASMHQLRIAIDARRGKEQKSVALGMLVVERKAIRSRDVGRGKGSAPVLPGPAGRICDGRFRPLLAMGGQAAGKFADDSGRVTSGRHGARSRGPTRPRRRDTRPQHAYEIPNDECLEGRLAFTHWCRHRN